jgi:hypothetical protein
LGGVIISSVDDLPRAKLVQVLLNIFHALPTTMTLAMAMVVTMIIVWKLKVPYDMFTQTHIIQLKAVCPVYKIYKRLGP